MNDSLEPVDARATNNPCCHSCQPSPAFAKSSSTTSPLLCSAVDAAAAGIAPSVLQLLHDETAGVSPEDLVFLDLVRPKSLVAHLGRLQELLPFHIPVVRDGIDPPQPLCVTVAPSLEDFMSLKPELRAELAYFHRIRDASPLAREILESVKDVNWYGTVAYEGRHLKDEPAEFAPEPPLARRTKAPQREAPLKNANVFDAFGIDIGPPVERPAKRKSGCR